MLPIQVEENEIKKFCGRPVCVVTKDGRRYMGRLSSCEEGKLILNDNPYHAQSHSNIPILTAPQTKAKSDHTHKKNMSLSHKKKRAKGKTALEADFHPNSDNQVVNPYDGNPYGDPYPNNYPGLEPGGFPPPYPYPPY
ncbi:hypothetical protein [Paenibacillus agilis]|uniref:Uncharacterized protein n=1 Tax=Paenibacillus agilis TaxID=3020863 RepID=A0A559IHF5_9BACL|nr:hypothetical protein [Paenibacillus agilis]TVX87051.1 hypothetical protein FPZ44_21340 [Paenibacillus agilis]